MMKKFLSLVALSAILITPAFADEFVPLRYYDEPTPILPQTYIPKQNNTANIIGFGSLPRYGQTTIDERIWIAIIEKNAGELVFLLELRGMDTLTAKDIADEVENGNIESAVKILDMEDAYPNWSNDWDFCVNYCLSKLNQNGDPKKDRQAFPCTNCLKQCLGRMI